MLLELASTVGIRFSRVTRTFRSKKPVGSMEHSRLYSDWLAFLHVSVCRASLNLYFNPHTAPNRTK